MRKVILFLMALFIVFISSCSDNDDDSQPVPTPPFVYQGNWSGTYSGSQDNGVWSVNVNASGVVSGTATSSVFSENYQLNGNVTNQGVFTATFGTSSVGGEFNGQLSGNNASGTWINTTAAMNGTWIGVKQ